MNIDTWAVVLATIIGPVSAVFITRWNDHRREDRNRRLHVYRVLMATRRSNISEDHVAAINLVEVEFHGVTPVIEAWSAYLTHLNTPSPSNATEAQHGQWNERRGELLAILLVKIAAHLGITKGEIEILHGGYAPQGWATRDQRLVDIQNYAIRLSQGQAVVPMVAMQQTAPNNPYPPAP
ncbi:MAG: DUF6680 family protein [Pseudolabrys sp.]